MIYIYKIIIFYRLQAQNESENDKSISIIQQGNLLSALTINFTNLFYIAEEMERQKKIEKQKWAVHWFGIIIVWINIYYA